MTGHTKCVSQRQQVIPTMKTIWLLFALWAVSGSSLNAATSVPQKAAIQAVIKTVQQQFSHATAVNIKRQMIVTQVDIQGVWVRAAARPVRKDRDPVTVLLHRQGRQWKIVTFGTSLIGAGQQYHVPRRLWSRWNLGNS